MRVSRETAEKNRKRVVRTASEEFRKHGYDGIGIAGLMKAAGLTQGGFYKQFDNKEALEVEATELALKENFSRWSEATDQTADPIAALKDWYLTPQHVDAIQKGCTYATLGAEATRDRPALQKVFGEAAERQIDDLSKALGGGADSRDMAIQTMAQMIGTLILARSVADGDARREILAAGRRRPL